MMPGSEFGYSWIRNGVRMQLIRTGHPEEGTIPDFDYQPILGYAPRSGYVKNSSGTYVPAISFASASISIVGS